MKGLEKYSFGVGDRFGMEGTAQLSAIIKAREQGFIITPVWNKSNREHLTVQSEPRAVRKEADETVKILNYSGTYLVDADHININNVDRFIPYSDFFTIDVAEFIGKKPTESDKEGFLKFIEKYINELHIPGIDREIRITTEQIEEIIETFLYAAKKAGEIYTYIASSKEENFVVEVSMDEVAHPQSPVELFFVLAALTYYKVPIKTIAPKFTGQFNKGVDYVGDLNQFAKEFEEDVLVISYSIQEFDLSKELKLSVHSGSDKFSIYPIINKLIKKHKVGLHVKTAGTTWLEEIIGLAESEGEAFKFAAGIYGKALLRFDELTAPYVTVLDIDKNKLPSLEQLLENGGQGMANALRHDPTCEIYNPHLRQLMHCAYKIAAEEGDVYIDLLITNRRKIEDNVTHNIFERHLKPLFF